jgi:hypothetical protein
MRHEAIGPAAGPCGQSSVSSSRGSNCRGCVVVACAQQLLLLERHPLAADDSEGAVARRGARCRGGDGDTAGRWLASLHRFAAPGR